MTAKAEVESINQVQDALQHQLYIADRQLATSIFLALRLQKPLFLEGEAGVGKTEIAKVLAAMLDCPLIRLQCYEGLDVNSAVYEWNYSRQMIEIRVVFPAPDSPTMARHSPSSSSKLTPLRAWIAPSPRPLHPLEGG